MKRQPWGLYAVALAIIVVGLVWAGVPASTLLFAALFLACPLMMIAMMRGMHGADTSDRHDRQRDNAPDHTDERHDAGRW